MINIKDKVFYLSVSGDTFKGTVMAFDGDTAIIKTPSWDYTRKQTRTLILVPQLYKLNLRRVLYVAVLILAAMAAYKHDWRSYSIGVCSHVGNHYAVVIDQNWLEHPDLKTAKQAEQLAQQYLLINENAKAVPTRTTYGTFQIIVELE